MLKLLKICMRVMIVQSRTQSSPVYDRGGFMEVLPWSPKQPLPDPPRFLASQLGTRVYVSLLKLLEDIACMTNIN